MIHRLDFMAHQARDGDSGRRIVVASSHNLALARVAQRIERHRPKVGVGGSSPSAGATHNRWGDHRLFDREQAIIVIRSDGSTEGDVSTMELTVKTGNVQLSSTVEDLIARRWEAIDRVGGNTIDHAQLEVRSFQPRRGADIYISQLTMTSGKRLIRAEERSTDAEAAVSASLDKALNQVRSYIGKRKSLRTRGQVSRDEVRADVASESRDLGEAVDAEELEHESTPQIVRSKRFEMKPMTPEEAAEQMDLLGHDFYFFNNSETGSHSVLYRRQDGDLGMLSPA